MATIKYDDIGLQVVVTVSVDEIINRISYAPRATGPERLDLSGLTLIQKEDMVKQFVTFMQGEQFGHPKTEVLLSDEVATFYYDTMHPKDQGDE